MPRDPAEATRDLSRAVIRFAALLRRHGLPVSLLQVTDAVRALERLDLGDREEVRLGLRTVLVGRSEDLPAFDRCFEAFWRADAAMEEGLPGLVDLAPDAALESSGLASSGQKRETRALDTWGAEEDEEGGEPLGVPGVSDLESLAGQDFSTFSPDQLEEVFRLTVQIARRLARRLSRRRRPIARDRKSVV